MEVSDKFPALMALWLDAHSFRVRFHTDLLACSKIGDPYFRTNEKGFANGFGQDRTGSIKQALLFSRGDRFK